MDVTRTKTDRTFPLTLPRGAILQTGPPLISPQMGASPMVRWTSEHYDFRGSDCEVFAYEPTRTLESWTNREELICAQTN